MAGCLHSGAIAGRDFMRDGETVVFGNIAYQIHPDINMGLFGIYGQFDYKNETYRNGEATIYALWKPKSESMKNWSARTKFGPGWSYKNEYYVPTNDKRVRAKSWCTEFIVEYHFDLL